MGAAVGCFQVIFLQSSHRPHQKTEEEWQNFVDLALKAGPDDKRKKVPMTSLSFPTIVLSFATHKFWYLKMEGYNLKGNEHKPLLSQQI